MELNAINNELFKKKVKNKLKRAAAYARFSSDN